MPENMIERYLTDMGETRGTRSNVAETSFYPALERLLSDIGKTLSPKVRCVKALIALQTSLDANYHNVIRTTDPFDFDSF
jgi:hypothetical protein